MKTVTIEVGDLLSALVMSGGSALVAVNALLLKRTRLESIRAPGLTGDAGA